MTGPWLWDLIQPDHVMVAALGVMMAAGIVSVEEVGPDCLLIVHERTRTLSRHPPPWPGHSFPGRFCSSSAC